MGGGSYCVVGATTRSNDAGYHTKSVHEIFTQREITNDMSPKNVKIRESRDNKEHPNSLAIILGLDVTGSMGHIPHGLVKNGLTQIMGNIIQAGEPDPQVLFAAIGDHECDRSPLQIGQFESSDELLDKWLTQVYLEGGGGGNDGESYLLAWYFAARHTSIDCYEKRNEKGFLFTIGDEKTLKSLPSRAQEKIMGVGQFSDLTAGDLLRDASKKYHVYHIHVKETWQGSEQSNIDDWKQLMGKNVVVVEKSDEIAKTISQIIISHKKHSKPVKEEVQVNAEQFPETEEML